MGKHLSCKISVIIPVYNAQKYLREALDSMLSQTFKDFEVLCVDDCSTDSSWDILQEYASKDQRIKVFKNEENLRLAGNLNKLLGLVDKNVKYIVRMDNDDISLPQRLQVQFDFMEEHPEVDICGAWIEYFGVNNKVVKHPTEHKEIVKRLQVGCVIAHPTVIMRKSFVDNNTIQYDRNYLLEDYELWARCFVDYDAVFANIPQVLLKYRVHPEQISMGVGNTIYNQNEKIKDYIFNSLSFNQKLMSPIFFEKLRRFMFRLRITKNQKIIRIFGVYLLNK